MKQKLNLRLFVTLFVGVFVSVSALAQDIVVKGHVKDDLGEDVIGASVRLKGTGTGTVTDMNGNFTLKAEKGTTLVVQFIGYISQEFKAASSVNIVLKEDSKLLNETVVVGYGSVKKSDLTGSVIAIKPDEMTKGITTNMQDMLTGKIPGVTTISDGGDPGANSSIRIRGGASLSASNDPLIVIDGLPMDNDGAKGLGNPFALVNPSDIETLTVLKDASATAIYGSRASNGVIIITTKKGLKGKAPKVTYSGDVSVSKSRKRYEVLSGDEFRSYAQSLVEKGTLSAAAYSQLGDENTDWQDLIYRNAVSTNHHIGIAGALPNMPYRVSFGYTNKQGIVKNSSFERFSGSVNINPSFFDNHLTFNVNAKYMHGKNQWVDYGVFSAAHLADPTQAVYDSSYETTGGYWQNLYTTGTKSLTDWNSGVTNTNTPQNPVALLNNYSRTAKSNAFIGGIEAVYKIHGFEDLSLHGSVSGNYTEGNNPTTISPYSYSNNYYGYSGYEQSYKYNLLGNFFVEYAHNWNEIHDFKIMAGLEHQHFHRVEWEEGGGNWLGTTLNPSASLSDWQSPIYRANTERLFESSLLSRFARVNYNLYDRYLFTFTARLESSSMMAKGKENTFNPSAAFAWKINDESWFGDNEVLSELKLRLGWGITGQQGSPVYYYTKSRYLRGDMYAQYSLGNETYTTSRPEPKNEDLGWENTTTYNVGLDFGFLNGRIDGSIDAYIRKTDDLIGYASQPAGNLSNYMLGNIGDLRNKGIEFNINAHPIVSRDFSWTVNYNIAVNSNKITNLNLGSGADYALTGESTSAGLNNQVMVNKEGYAVNSFYVYQQVYDENGRPIEGQYVDRDGDGKITDSDRYVYKHADADVLMGMTNKFIYKNWDFSFTLRASLNNYVYYDFLSNKAIVSATGIYSNSAFNNTTSEAVKLGFQGDKLNYYASDYFVRNASFLRCDNITLGYSFNRLFETASYHGLDGRVYFLVLNPFVITKYDGLDPELSANNSGVDKSLYPRPTTYMFGLTLNF